MYRLVKDLYQVCTAVDSCVQSCTDMYREPIALESTNQIQVFSTNVSIKEHKELLCPKRIVCCIYKSTGCPHKGPADTMMSHQASCQYRPGYHIIKCEICGDPIHLPKFSKTKFENQKRCFNCRLEVKMTSSKTGRSSLKLSVLYIEKLLLNQNFRMVFCKKFRQIRRLSPVLFSIDRTFFDSMTIHFR